MVEMNQFSQKIFRQYNLHLSGESTEGVLEILDEGCSDFFGLAPQRYDLWFWPEKVTIQLLPLAYGGLTRAGLIQLNPKGLTTWTVVHELAHAWDAANGWRLSRQLARFTGSDFSYTLLHLILPKVPAFWYQVGSPPPPCGAGKNFNRFEDFAETVTASVYPEEAKRRAEKRGMPYSRYGYDSFLDTPRGKWLQSLLKS